MTNASIKQKIINDLEGFKQTLNADDVIASMAKRYNVPENVVHKVIAEWSAGKDVGNKKEDLS